MEFELFQHPPRGPPFPAAVSRYSGTNLSLSERSVLPLLLSSRACAILSTGLKETKICPPPMRKEFHVLISSAVLGVFTVGFFRFHSPFSLGSYVGVACSPAALQIIFLRASEQRPVWTIARFWLGPVRLNRLLVRLLFRFQVEQC